MAKSLWSRRTFERVFAPALADLIHEWQEAEAAGEIWKSRWIRFVRAPWSLLAHMISSCAVAPCAALGAMEGEPVARFAHPGTRAPATRRGRGETEGLPANVQRVQ